MHVYHLLFIAKKAPEMTPIPIPTYPPTAAPSIAPGGPHTAPITPPTTAPVPPQATPPIAAFASTNCTFTSLPMIAQFTNVSSFLWLLLAEFIQIENHDLYT